MKISFVLANKLASFKNAKQKFEVGTEYKLNYPKGESADEKTMITIDDNREITVGDLINLFVSIERDGEFMKKGVRPTTMHEQLLAKAKKAGKEEYPLPKSIKITDRVNIGTTLENVEKLDNSARILDGYKLHGIDTSADRIPQLWATGRKDAKYDKKDDFNVRTKIVVEAIA